VSRVLAYYTSILPFCCGANEVGEMSVEDGEPVSNSYGRNRVILDQAIQKILNSAEGRPVFFNFVQECKLDEDEEETGEFYDDYNAHEFMELVEAHPRVVDLGTWINPGTGNRIHGFMILGNNHE